jgi:hypothetical protein
VVLHDKDLVACTHQEVIPIGQLFDCFSQVSLMRRLRFLYGLSERLKVKVFNRAFRLLPRSQRHGRGGMVNAARAGAELAAAKRAFLRG